MYNWLAKQGYKNKYEHAGIYCIKLDDEIVYIGKSRNMLRRVAEHYVGIKSGSEKKYRLISEIQRKGHPVTFDVLYDAESTNYYDTIEEIGEKEGEYIRSYNPIFNAQVPKEEDWRKFEWNVVNAREILKEWV